ncbi:hypothetical protein P154DRAFT_616187 [Amniculicola lignicola CBS 123094]|uniref:BRCT domain-containing protein n=1 Tax=Amniculicola lignicola CBS 123094 TaxID=1392246 RepID=A0A6A5WVZ4_9PLEO|nr:hypothetical protein P154DRAFT_616187 [Amniculicola lignicola CBS 123094]
MPSPFTSLTITAIGDFGSSAPPSKLRQWVEKNGGIWAPKLSREVTHLILGEKEYKGNIEGAKKAQEAGIWVVSYDWLEDSLQKRRRLAEKWYTWEYLREKKKKGREMKRLGRLADAKNFNKGCEIAREETGSGMSKRKPSSARKVSSPAITLGTSFKSSLAELKERREKRAQSATASTTQCNDTASPKSTKTGTKTIPADISTESQQGPKTEKLTDNYHIYRDHCGLDYNVLLIRTNLSANKTTTYNIRLFESNTVPHMYCTFIRYTPPAITEDPPNPNTTSNVPNDTATPSSSDTTPNLPPCQHPSFLRLKALISPHPKPDHPFRTLLTLPPSPFETAFATFRAAFRDLTLLPWELRISPSARYHQIALAKTLNVEPFVYRRPVVGMPVGVLYEMENNGWGKGEREEWPWTGTGYVRGRLGLPGMEEGLSRSGGIGLAVFKEEEEMEVARVKREAEETARVKEEKLEDGEEKPRKLVLKLGNKREEGHRGPLFNGVSGTVTLGEGREKEKKSASGGGLSLRMAGGGVTVKKEEAGDMRVKLRVGRLRPSGPKRWSKSGFYDHER